MQHGAQNYWGCYSISLTWIFDHIVCHNKRYYRDIQSLYDIWRVPQLLCVLKIRARRNGIDSSCLFTPKMFTALLLSFWVQVTSCRTTEAAVLRGQKFLQSQYQYRSLGREADTRLWSHLVSLVFLLTDSAGWTVHQGTAWPAPDQTQPCQGTTRRVQLLTGSDGSNFSFIILQCYLAVFSL